MQTVMGNIDMNHKEYLGEYAQFPTYKGYLKMLYETLTAVLKKTGAE